MFSSTAVAQDTIGHLIEVSGIKKDKQEDDVYDIVEVMPEFPGGDAAKRRFIAEHLQYPSVDKGTNISGKVQVVFVVLQDGKLDSIKIWKKFNPALDEAVLRVIQKMPKWKPGRQGAGMLRSGINYLFILILNR